MKWLLVTASAMLVFNSLSVEGQVFGSGPCPTYQTSDKFTVDKVGEMVGGDGHVPYLSSGTVAEADQTCQFFRLNNGAMFTYSYKDSSGEPHTITGQYEVVPSSYKDPGYMRLSTGSMGILGSDITGFVNLHPVYMDERVDVYVSCTSFGVFHAEFAYAFLRPGHRKSGDVEDIKYDLVSKGVPLADSLKMNDQRCFTEDPEMRRRYPQYVNNLRSSGIEVPSIEIDSNAEEGAPAVQSNASPDLKDIMSILTSLSERLQAIERSQIEQQNRLQLNPPTVSDQTKRLPQIPANPTENIQDESFFETQKSQTYSGQTSSDPKKPAAVPTTGEFIVKPEDLLSNLDNVKKRLQALNEVQVNLSAIDDNLKGADTIVSDLTTTTTKLDNVDDIRAHLTAMDERLASVDRLRNKLIYARDRLQAAEANDPEVLTY